MLVDFATVAATHGSRTGTTDVHVHSDEFVVIWPEMALCAGVLNSNEGYMID
jgi:hypothetical protein